MPQNNSSQTPKHPKVRLEDEPLNVEPVQTGISPVLADKMSEKMEQEVTEALGDVARRKEYREALERAGISMDFLVEALKNIAVAGEKDSDKIKALQVLLKSLGVDKTNSKDEEQTDTWEEALLKESAPEVETGKDYEVNTPEMPESARKKREDDDKVTGGIYA